MNAAQQTPVEVRILQDLAQSLYLAFETDPGDFEWTQLTPYSAFEVAEFDDEGKVIRIHHVAVQINPTPEEGN